MGSLRHLSESDDERVFLGCKPSSSSMRSDSLKLARGRGHASGFQHHVDAYLVLQLQVENKID